MHRLSLALLAILTLVRAARADDLDPMYACRALPASAKITVSVKPETSVADLALWVTGFTCKNVVFSADVAKRATKVTVISSKPMSPAQAVKLFVDAVEATGLVVVQKPDTFIVKLGPGMPKTCPDLGGATATATPPVVTEPPVPPLTEAELDAAIKSTDATHASITRALLDRVLANPMQIATEARVVPVVANGKPDGLKLYAIRPKSVWARLGLQNGDQLRRVNAQDISSPDKALEVYAALRDAKTVSLELLRGGKPLTIAIAIR